MTATLPSLGIGIGAPGLNAPPPSPGETATLTVVTERVFRDGYTTLTTDRHVWDGYTPETALKQRLTRLREAGRNVRREGNTLIITTDRVDWVETEMLRWEAA